MEQKILKLLAENARISEAEIAVRLNITENMVKEVIKELKDRGVICGFTTILNENKIKDNKVKALIEVKVTPKREGGFDQIAKRIANFPEVTDLFLVSGSFDLLLTVEGESLQEVASFVSEKLSTLDGIVSTATVFLLKKYKESNRIMQNDEEYERLKICP